MAEKTMPITGGCMCGAVRYEATEPPQEVGYCHCRMCQKWTGNLFLPGAGFRSAAFRFTQGEPKFYRSSAWLERGFCANCGTPVCDRYLKGSDTVYASIGSLDHPEDWPPSAHWGVESQVPWLTIDDDLPRMRTEEDAEFLAAKAAVEEGEE
jgi:hypothetical protein